jgi:hypothetical protein
MNLRMLSIQRPFLVGLAIFAWHCAERRFFFFFCVFAGLLARATAGAFGFEISALQRL